MELKTFYHFDISEIAEKFECEWDELIGDNFCFCNDSSYPFSLDLDFYDEEEQDELRNKVVNYIKGLINDDEIKLVYLDVCW